MKKHLDFIFRIVYEKYHKMKKQRIFALKNSNEKSSLLVILAIIDKNVIVRR